MVLVSAIGWDLYDLWDLYGPGRELQTANCKPQTTNGKRVTCDRVASTLWQEVIPTGLTRDDLQPSRCNLKLDGRGTGYITVQL
jgi:hypothetical protein